MMRARARLLGAGAALLVLATAAGCADGTTDLGGELSAGEVAFAGEVEVRIVDYPDGSHEQRYHLRGADGRARRLHFTQDPELGPGDRIEGRGVVGSDGRSLHVGTGKFRARQLPLGALEHSQQPLVGAAALPKRRVAFVLVDLGQGVNLTPEAARTRAFGNGPTDRSIRKEILEYSFGKQDIEGEVIGPLKGTMSGCDEDGLADSLRAQIPAGFQNIFWYFGRRVSACGWAGVAPLGRPDRIAGELWVNGTATCAVATHEFGHNLGLQHASRIRCPGGAPFVDTPAMCQSSEYGDINDVMGDGCNHFNGYSKWYLRWFEKCNGVRLNQSTTVTLLPMAQACNGVQVVQVPMPKTRTFQDLQPRNYFLELRSPIGLDTNIQPQVQVRIGTNIGMGIGARRTGVLDMKPMTSAIDGLRQGEMFQDPAGGVRFTVMALSAEQATVKVDIDAPVMAGPPTCLDGTPFTPPGPPTCGEGSMPPAPPTGPRPDGGGDPVPPVNPDAGAGGAGGSGTGGTGGSGTGGTGGSAGAGTGGAGGSGAGTGGSNSTGAGGSGAGTGGSGAGGARPTRDAGASTPPPQQPTTVPGGCSCELGGGPTPGGATPGLAVSLVALALVFRRRRSRP